MNESGNIFYDEFMSKLESMEDVLISIDVENSDMKKLNELFRAIHTIKGTADILGME